MAALLVVTLPLAALAGNGHGHGKTRVYIGGSFWLGPPAWGPAAQRGWASTPSK